MNADPRGAGTANATGPGVSPTGRPEGERAPQRDSVEGVQ